MPQLSPLNWMFLFIFFWAALMMVLVGFWWRKKLTYSLLAASPKTLSNKWHW